MKSMNPGRQILNLLYEGYPQILPTLLSGYGQEHIRCQEERGAATHLPSQEPRSAFECNTWKKTKQRYMRWYTKHERQLLPISPS